MSRFQSIEDVWQFLDAIPMFQNAGISAANFSLDNIRDFCGELGNPQNQFPSIHVAGTNGKGTTCYLLEQVYTEAGYKTGLFTSPHLLRYNERVRVGKQEITDEQIVEFFQLSEPIFSQIKLSYFEISTALAFWFFAKQEVDISIIETGLGGRLDSTNIITPKLAVITSIGPDHQNILGNSLEEIAREKAGIIKPNTPIVIGNISGGARKVIEEIAAERDSKMLPAQRADPTWNKGLILLKSESLQLQTNFKESVNKWNVAVSYLSVKKLQTEFPVEKTMFIKAVESFKGAPGRFEKMHSRYDWYFSGSHNAQALESSVQAVKAIKPVSESILIFSAMKDKLNEEMLEYFKGFKKAYFVQQEGDRAAKFTDLKEDLEVELLTEDQKENILNELKTELVIFMGSFYFYPIVKRWTANVS